MINTKAGKKNMNVTKAYADVVLETSAYLLFTNYDVPASAVNGVFQPNLAGDQLALNLILTTKGAKLGENEYLPVGANPNAAQQLNFIAAYSAAGREIVGGITRKTGFQVTLTKIDDKQVCGSIETDEAAGSFVAARI